jgi:hypothetical protein
LSGALIYITKQYKGLKYILKNNIKGAIYIKNNIKGFNIYYKTI